MADEGRQQSWSEYLDRERENKLFVRFVFSSDFREVEEFAVVYLTAVDGKSYEVMRYDCTKYEAVNVHQFFHKQAEKKYLKREKTFETLEEFIADVRKNWRIYRVKFLEK